MDWQNFSTELELGITTHCQAACPFCVRTHIADSLHLMHLKLNDVKNFFNDLPNAIQTIRVCGNLGDPLMNPHLDDILDFLVFDKKLNFRLHTNGGIRNESWFKDCARLGNHCNFVFGIDGTTQEINDIYRKNVDFEKAFNNMIACNRALPKGNVLWQFLVFPHNYHQVEEAKQIARKNDIRIEYTINTRLHFDDDKNNQPWILDEAKQQVMLQDYHAWTEDY